MALIPADKAELGMILSAPVMDRRGRLLMPAGRELEEKHLEALPMWGVTQIEVEGDGPEAGDDPATEVEPWALEKAGEEMDQLFLHVEETHPVMLALREFRTLTRAEEIQKEGQP